MKHARKDYDERIQDSAGLIPDDEPVFLIRGQDAAAVPAARAWCDEAERIGTDPALVAHVRDFIEEVVVPWQLQNEGKVKVPDAPEDVLR